MKILLIGPQGSGKSTQGKLLGEFLKIPVISTGEIFRKIRQQNNEEGRSIRQIYDEGKLVDDQTTAWIVEKRLKELDSVNGFILDGYPRNIDQVNLFDPGFDRVIYLDVLKEEAIKRLMERGRSDDTLGLIKRRLDLYYEQTQPLLDYYKNQEVLREVNGIGSIEKVQNEIKKCL